MIHPGYRDTLRLRSDLLWDNLIKGYVNMLSRLPLELKGLFIDVVTDYNPILRQAKVSVKEQLLIGQCLHRLKHDGVAGHYLSPALSLLSSESQRNRGKVQMTCCRNPEAPVTALRYSDLWV